jgi:hypothetical protein
MRIAFYDKLVILNGGTLALSFTAAFGLYQRVSPTLHIAAIGYLFLAWKLLMISIVSSLISNWLSIHGTGATSTYLTTKMTETQVTLTQSALRGINPETEVKVPTNTEQEKTAHKIAGLCKNLGSLVGIASLIITFISYVYLFKFATANLLGP